MMSFLKNQCNLKNSLIENHISAFDEISDLFSFQFLEKNQLTQKLAETVNKLSQQMNMLKAE